MTGSLDAVARDAARRSTGGGKLIVGLLDAIPGISCPEPEGAFYAYPSVTGLIGKSFDGVRPASSGELATLILEKAEVAVVPGEAFGTPGYFRLSYALERRGPGHRRHPDGRVPGDRAGLKLTRSGTGQLS